MGEITEFVEQVQVVKALDAAGIWYCHVPNGMKTTKREGARAVRSGLKKGVPDLLIFDPPPCGGYVGAAIEMKRSRPCGSPSDVTPEQGKWLRELDARGWACRVAFGQTEAKLWLKSLGYKL